MVSEPQREKPTQGQPDPQAAAGRRYIRDLTSGETVDEVYLVTGKHLRANRSGGLYLQIELRDRTGVISSRMWNATERLFDSFEVNDFLRVRGRTQIYQGELQLILSEIRRVPQEQVDLNDFLPQTAQSVDRLMVRLRELLSRIEHPDLVQLVETILVDETLMAKLAAAPAAVRFHHAYRGGLLEHVVTMLEIADRIAPLYPGLDIDLLFAGILLHDIGKVDELSYHAAFRYTDEGELVGHLVQGVELLNEKIREVEELTGRKFPAELAMRLKHMILSHHGALEFGSPKVPLTLEALALHLIDNLDAKLAAFQEEVGGEGKGQWTEPSPLFRRRLYRGRPKDG